MRARLTAALVLFIAAISVTIGVVRDAPRPGPTRYLLINQQSVAERDLAVTSALDGYHILSNNYVDTLPPQPLLAAGWNAAVTFAKNAGINVAAMPTAPPADESAFKTSLGTLIDASLEHLPAPDIARASISGMARSLNDNHTVFIGPVSWKTVETGQAVTIGYNFMREPRGYLVWETLPDLPAARAGIRPGDLVTAIDGRSVAQGASPRPDAPKANVAQTYKLERAGAAIEIQVTPETVHQLTTHGELLQGDIAYLRIYSFSVVFSAVPSGDGTREYLRELDKEIDTLKAAKPAGWLLDMRENLGGNEFIAAYLATRLGLEGPLVENRERGGRTTLIPSVGRSVTDGRPVAVVINEGSASAAEIVAASLQDSRVAKVYGVKSPGLVNTARYFPVAGGGLEITVARAYSGPLKRVIDKVGVTPDESVALDPSSPNSAWSDAQLDRAIAYLRSQALVVSAAR